MLLTLYGEGQRGGVNARKAATKLGVSERTIRRWAKDGLPATEAAKKLETRHKRWQRGPKGRENALQGRMNTFQQRGAAATLKGDVAISGDRRHRQLNLALTAADMTVLRDVAVHGNESDLKAAMEQIVGQQFGGSVTLELDALDFQ